MNRNLLFTVSILFSVAVGSVPAFGVETTGELDNEATIINEQAQRDLPQTVVIRVDEKTGAAAVLELKDSLPASADGQSLVAASGEAFKALGTAVNSPAGELDRTSSSSSWYVWFNYGAYYTPTYSYWGYNYAYTNYYWYNWGGYNYYWYCYRW